MASLTINGEARESAADTVTLWGSGTPRREFLHVDDCARACLHLMLHYNEPGPINIGVGEDIPIADLARLVARVVKAGGHTSTHLINLIHTQQRR